MKSKSTRPTKRARFYARRSWTWEGKATPYVFVCVERENVEPDANGQVYAGDLCLSKFARVFGFTPPLGKTFEITFTPTIREVK